MKSIERLFRRIAYIGTGWAVDGPTPPGNIGLIRNRLLHVAIAFGWMAKGGPYDNRTFAQRTIKNKSARSYFRYALTGRFYPRAA